MAKWLDYIKDYNLKETTTYSCSCYTDIFEHYGNMLGRRLGKILQIAVDPDIEDEVTTAYGITETHASIRPISSYQYDLKFITIMLAEDYSREVCTNLELFNPATDNDRHSFVIPRDELTRLRFQTQFNTGDFDGCATVSHDLLNLIRYNATISLGGELGVKVDYFSVTPLTAVDSGSTKSDKLMQIEVHTTVAKSTIGDDSDTRHI